MPPFLRFVLLLVGATALSPSLQAEDSCSALYQYMDSARNGFQSIRGKKTEFGDWNATVFLPQANRCEIEDAGDNYFTATCKYLFLDQADRRSGLQQMRAAIEACLGWASGSLRDSRKQQYKGVKGYDITIIPLGKFDAQLEITYLGYE